MQEPAPPTSTAPTASGGWRAWGEIGLIFLVFFVYAGTKAPAINEAHYLSKAKHFWNPDWCARDLFLQSADAHQFFYATFGVLSLWLPLPALAWVGRVIVWGLLAWSWRRLSVAIVPRPLMAVLSAALMVTLIAKFSMAGEWIIGGVEAKDFAFVFLFLALEALARGLWNRAWIMLGIAGAFHILVGGWGAVAVALVWSLSSERPSLLKMAPGMIVGALCCLPGLIPALVLNRGVDPLVAAEATKILVFDRLPHHLLITAFKREQVISFAILVLLLMTLGRRHESEERRRIDLYVLGTLLLTLVGVLITVGTWYDPLLASKLLRYYWYRAADVAVPIGAALWLTSVLARGWDERARWATPLLFGLLLFAGWSLGGIVVERTVAQRESRLFAPAENRLSNPSDWREACEWIATSGEIPSDALFITPYDEMTFHWRAGRATVVNRKDVPQDAPGAVEWWRRLQDIHRAGNHHAPAPWHESLVELGEERLVQLGRKYGAEYVIAPAEPALALPRVGPVNNAYTIYRLTTDPIRKASTKSQPASDRP